MQFDISLNHEECSGYQNHVIGCRSWGLYYGKAWGGIGTKTRNMF